MRRLRLLGGIAAAGLVALPVFLPPPVAAASLVVVFGTALMGIGVRRARRRQQIGGPSVAPPAPEPTAAVEAEATVDDQTPDPPPGPCPGTVSDLIVGPTDILDDYVVRLPSRVVVEGRVATGFFAGQVPGTTFHVRGVVLRGLEHAALGEEGQDAVGATWSTGHDSVCVGVGDGLGSLRDSAAASGLAVRTALAALAASESRHNLADAFHRAGHQLRQTIDREGLRAATTLAIAEIQVADRGAIVSIGTVGDSEAWLFTGNAWRPLARRRRDVTHALPASVDARVIRERVPRGAVVVLATDGFALALGEGTSTLARELAARWRTPPAPLEFVNHVDFKAEDFLDDRGVVAVWV